MGEAQNRRSQLSFNTALKIEFQGSRVIYAHLSQPKQRPSADAEAATRVAGASVRSQLSRIVLPPPVGAYPPRHRI